VSAVVARRLAPRSRHAPGLDVSVQIKLKTLSATVVLRAVTIVDPRDGAIYRKVRPAWRCRRHGVEVGVSLQILSVAGAEVLRLKFVQFNRTDEEKEKMRLDEYDMGVSLDMLEMRFVFLNVWLGDLLVSGAATWCADGPLDVRLLAGLAGALPGGGDAGGRPGTPGDRRGRQGGRHRLPRPARLQDEARREHQRAHRADAAELKEPRGAARRLWWAFRCTQSLRSTGNRSLQAVSWSATASARRNTKRVARKWCATT